MSAGRHPHQIRLTKTRVQPVAYGGIDANIGAKKIDAKKHMPVVIPVRPVLPPSEIPEPDSIKTVTGEDPKRDPIEMAIASVQYATVDLGNDPVLESTTPENLAIE